MIQRTRPGRDALTLLEVIVAMAIFSFSIVAIFQLAQIGGDRAMEVRLQTRTSLRCQAKMAEIMIGAEPFSGAAGSYTPFTESDKDLQWKMEATPDAQNMLYTVKVWVKGDLPGRSVESYLCQMVLNPTKRGTTFDVPPPAAAPAPAQ